MALFAGPADSERLVTEFGVLSRKISKILHRTHVISSWGDARGAISRGRHSELEKTTLVASAHNYETNPLKRALVNFQFSKLSSLSPITSTSYYKWRWASTDFTLPGNLPSMRVKRYAVEIHNKPNQTGWQLRQAGIDAVFNFAAMPSCVHFDADEAIEKNRKNLGGDFHDKEIASREP